MVGVGLGHVALQQPGGGVDPVPGQKDPLNYGHINGIDVLDHIDQDDQQHQGQQQSVLIPEGEQPHQQPIPGLFRQPLRAQQQIHQGQNQGDPQKFKHRAQQKEKE